nr:PREDICTED: natterin-like protein [Lepisosteus oculatus]
MAYPTTVHIIFRYGGNASFDGQNDGATLEKIGVWVGGLKVNAVRIWLTNGKDRDFNMQVKAGIPELAEVSTGFSWTVGTEDTYKLENKTETTEKLSFKIQVPAGKTMEVAITLGHANVDLPYKGTVKVTCRNGSVLRFDTSGVYKGLTYTKGSVVVKEGS